VDDLRRQVQQQQHELQVLQAHPPALTACSIEELTALEGRFMGTAPPPKGRLAAGACVPADANPTCCSDPSRRLHCACVALLFV
jgi:hypothetical protein